MRKTIKRKLDNEETQIVEVTKQFKGETLWGRTIEFNIGDRVEIVDYTGEGEYIITYNEAKTECYIPINRIDRNTRLIKE